MTCTLQVLRQSCTVADDLVRRKLAADVLALRRALFSGGGRFWLQHARGGGQRKEGEGDLFSCFLHQLSRCMYSSGRHDE